MTDRPWIVVPAFNEAPAIEATLRGLYSYFPNVVVVDDGSRDDTGERARRVGAIVLRHPVNVGQGGALRTGIEFALGAGASHICTFDADGQHDPGTIDEMLSHLRTSGADVALASRFLGKSVGISPMKLLTLKVAIVITRLHSGLPLTDTHNGLRVFTRRAAEVIRINQMGMAHGSEILSEIKRNALSYVEVPTTITYTAYSMRKGQSIGNSVKILTDLWYHSWSG